MYKIGYLGNYNKFNTPRFTNLTSQDNFFDSHIICSIDAYYPPYYSNIIRLTTTDVSFNSRINFLYIIHNNKRYYYFINDINYINEEVFEISIEMDVIQTFMFNIEITDYVLERECIKRWKASNEINRDYIPENLSRGEFLIKKYDIDLTKNQLFEWYVVWSSKDWAENGSSNQFCSIINEDDTSNLTGLYCYLVPVHKNIQGSYDNYKTSVNSYEHSYTLTDVVSALPTLQVLDAATTVKIFKVNTHFINKILTYETEPVDTDTLKITFTRVGRNVFNDAKFKYSNSATNYFALSLSMYDNTYNFKEDYSISPDNTAFSKNTSLLTPFDYHFVPQVIDENYMQFNFGEKIYSATPQLRKYKATKLNLYMHYDINSGYRSYKTTDYLANQSFRDEYNSNMVIPLPQFLTLVNTAWSEYYATHFGSLTTGITQQYTNAAINLGKNVVGSYGMSSSTTSRSYADTYDESGATSSTTYRRNRGNNASYTAMKPKLSAYHNIGGSSGTSVNTDVTSSLNYTKLASAGIDAAQEMYNIQTNLQVLRENLHNSPASVGEGSEIFASLANYSDKLIKVLAVVTDIEYCAKKFELYGYAVHKIVNLNNTINNITRNRRYWNVYQISNCDITISSSNPCLISADLQGQYKMRLEAGIRFIESDIYDNIDTYFQYDNVELE